MSRETVVWYRIRSKKIVQWASLAAAMFRERLISKAAQLALLAGKAPLPGSLVFKFGENLGGNGVPFISRQAADAICVDNAHRGGRVQCLNE